jgi:hypothetical protein
MTIGWLVVAGDFVAIALLDALTRRMVGEFQHAPTSAPYLVFGAVGTLSGAMTGAALLSAFRSDR